MHDRRWDCTSLQHAPKFKRDLRKGTQERAYVHSLSSAAVAINVARRCALGDISKCNCKNRSTDQKFDDENQSVSFMKDTFTSNLSPKFRILFLLDSLH